MISLASGWANDAVKNMLAGGAQGGSDKLARCQEVDILFCIKKPFQEKQPKKS